MADRFDKFTEHARRVLVLAQEEAVSFGYKRIGTEHILLAIVREDGCTAAEALNSLGITAEKVRSSVEFLIGREGAEIHDQIALTERSKKAIKLAIDEARRTKTPYIGTEHLLLGLIREGEGIAASVLESLGIRSLYRVRAEVVRLIQEKAT